MVDEFEKANREFIEKWRMYETKPYRRPAGWAHDFPCGCVYVEIGGGTTLRPLWECKRHKRGGLRKRVFERPKQLSDQKPETKSQSDRIERHTLAEAFARVCATLKNVGVLYDIIDNKIFAKLEMRGRLHSYGLYISLRERDSEAQKYLDARISNVFRLNELDDMLRKLKRFLYHRAEPGLSDRLERDVLTCFGWHATERNQGRRRSCLSHAAAGLGEARVVNVLDLLRKFWKNHPNSVFSETYFVRAAEDYNWFYTNFGEQAYPYNRTKMELHRILLGESQSLINLRKTSLFRNVAEINRFFLVIY